ncbi:RNF4 ligase, partial [Spelaeornis formosus]|nr:RNF4 ligase [Elachura formosa]
RKRPGGAVNSTPARKRRRLLPSNAGGTSYAEAIDVEESTPAFEPEVIDLRGESSEPEVIIIGDDESSEVSSDWHTPSCSLLASNYLRHSSELLAWDSPEEAGDNEGYPRVLSNLAPSRAQEGVVIRCQICMDFYSEIMQKGRQLVAPHGSCNECLPLALDTSDMCPVCRRELRPEIYHPIYL